MDLCLSLSRYLLFCAFFMKSDLNLNLILLSKIYNHLCLCLYIFLSLLIVRSGSLSQMFIISIEIFNSPKAKALKP